MFAYAKDRKKQKSQPWDPRKEERAKKLRLSAHAWRRLAQRNITLSDIVIALKHGRRIHRAYADFYFLGNRDLPRGQERELGRLVGTTVVVEDSFIVTAYRNRRAFAKVKRKSKRYSDAWRNALSNMQVNGNQSMAAAQV